MGVRRLDGTALLVAGYGALGAHDASALHTLGQVGEALLATGDAWQIRRLAANEARGSIDRADCLANHSQAAGSAWNRAVWASSSSAPPCSYEYAGAASILRLSNARTPAGCMSPRSVSSVILATFTSLHTLPFRRGVNRTR